MTKGLLRRRHSFLLCAAIMAADQGAALAFDMDSAPEFKVTACQPMQRKFFLIRLESSAARRTLTFNKRAGLIIFRGTSEKDLKWTMPLSAFRFFADVTAPGWRMLSAVEQDSGRFDFGLIDERCWARLRNYGDGAIQFDSG